jgi:hypothetical protein
MDTCTIITPPFAVAFVLNPDQARMWKETIWIPSVSSQSSAFSTNPLLFTEAGLLLLAYLGYS